MGALLHCTCKESFGAMMMMICSPRRNICPRPPPTRSSSAGAPQVNPALHGISVNLNPEPLRVNQGYESIKPPHKAIHGQREATSQHQHHQRGQQTLRHAG